MSSQGVPDSLWLGTLRRPAPALAGEPQEGRRRRMQPPPVPVEKTVEAGKRVAKEPAPVTSARSPVHFLVQSPAVTILYFSTHLHVHWPTHVLADR